MAPVSPDPTPAPRPSRPAIAAGWISAYLALSVLVGALCGVFWSLVVELPTYTVRDDLTAVTTERGLAEYFGSDAWFVGIGLAVGAGLGLVAWRWFSELGWPVALLAAAGAALAGVVCWQMGEWLGPGPFDERLALAGAGDTVPIQFLLRSRVAFAAWVLGAVTPVLLWSSLGPDAEVPRAPSNRPRWTRNPRARVVEPTETGEVVGRDIDPLPR